MHKIKMEEEYKSIIQSKRWLNLKLKEVVKKDFLKLLEDGMIYIIYDSMWVSPILLVTKKDRMTVIKN